MFWFILVTALLLPVTMIAFGAAWKKHPPRDVNGVYGYRTAMSMKSQQTWDFAHQSCARWWFWTGLGLLVVSVAAMALFYRHSEVAVLWLMGIQLVAMLLSLLPTERALRRRFDRDGRPRDGIDGQ